MGQTVGSGASLEDNGEGDGQHSHGMELIIRDRQKSHCYKVGGKCWHRKILEPLSSTGMCSQEAGRVSADIYRVGVQEKAAARSILGRFICANP